MAPHPVTKIVARCFALLVAGFLVIPTLMVIPMAFSSGQFLQFPPPGWSFIWFQKFFQDDEWTSAITRSVGVSLAAAAIAVPIGTLAAYAVVTARRRTTKVIEPFLMSPSMVPVVISGFGLYLATLVFGVGQNLWVVTLAHAGLAVPFVLLTVVAALRTFDFRLVRAARVHGANPHQAFFRVVVPVIGPAIGAATIIAIMTSLDESVVALFLVGDTQPTLPVKMYTSITYELNPLVPVAATVLTVASVALMAIAAQLFRISRRRGLAGSPVPFDEVLA